jgi:peroxiredoxin family protein
MADKPRLSIIVHSGAFERVHYALVMASAAAAIDRPVTLFFTMAGCRALLPRERLGDWAAGDMDLAAKGLATLEELLTACAEIGVTFMVCEMGLRAEGLALADLRDNIPIAEVGAVTFLKDAGPNGPSLFV